MLNTFFFRYFFFLSSCLSFSLKPCNFSDISFDLPLVQSGIAHYLFWLGVKVVRTEEWTEKHNYYMIFF